MKIISDYHIHTPLCGHAKGEPAEYIQQALALGLTEIGFADHAPLVSHRDPAITMDFEDLPIYHSMMEDVREQFKNKVTVKIGIEADFLPGYEDKIKSILEAYPYDYVIGSVHFIKDWAFDNPDEMEGWDHADTDSIYRQYYDYLRRAAESKMFDVMAHVDLVKKFGHRPTVDLTDEIKKTARVFKDTGVVIEVNTSGLRKPVKEIYPTKEVLSIYCRAGVPLTFGSDSHAPREVGKDFDKASALAVEAGYRTYVLFKQRKIEKTVSLV